MISLRTAWEGHLRTFRSSIVIALLVALQSACTDVRPTEAHAPPLKPRVVLTPQWAGGEVRVTSSSFTPAEPFPSLVAGATNLTVRRVDDSTVAARMPPLGGSYALQVTQGVSSVTLGPIVLDGFRGEVTGPYMSGKVFLLNPGGASPLVLASGDSGALVLDLVADTVIETIPDSVSSPDCGDGPGPSYRGPTYFVFGGSIAGVCQPLIAWQAYPSLAVMDSSPVRGFDDWDVFAEVGPHRWFANSNNHAFLWNCASGPCSFNETFDTDGIYDVLLTPDDSLFTWLPSSFPGSNGGPPSAFSVSTMDTAVLFPGVGSLLAGQFSDDGDTLFAVTQAVSGTAVAYTPLHATALLTHGGQVVRDQPLDSLGLGAASQRVYAIGADPSRRWVYVVVGYPQDSTIVPTLVVLDRATWSIVGIAEAEGASPAAVDDLVTGGTGWVIPAPSLHQVFIVAAKDGFQIHQHHGAILSFATP